MNFLKAKKLFEHTLTSEERVSKKINDALLAMIDEDAIEAASSLVSAAVHGTERVWMTSDLHFGHTNIIKYCGRPFPTIGHQDDTIIRLLSKVAPDELIVFVGDLALGNYQEGVDILKKLPGRKILVAGNHDITKEGKCRLASEGIFEYVVPFLYFRGVQEDLKRLNLELASQKEQLEKLNISLREMAMTDALTLLPNRRLLIDRVEQALHAAKRSKQIGALLFMDSDNFKSVNDQLGHEAGDLLLKEIARRLLATVREADTVARISGDEFVVMLENLGADPAQAESQIRTIAQKILDCLSQPYTLGSVQCTNTVSIGATLMHEGHQSFDDLCQQADVAMYMAKKAGRNTFRMSTPTPTPAKG